MSRADKDIKYLKEHEPIVPGYKTMLIEDKRGTRMVDIREYSESQAASLGHGWTKKGLRFENLEQLNKAIEVLTHIRDNWGHE